MLPTQNRANSGNQTWSHKLLQLPMSRLLLLVPQFTSTVQGYDNTGKKVRHYHNIEVTGLNKNANMVVNMKGQGQEEMEEGGNEEEDDCHHQQKQKTYDLLLTGPVPALMIESMPPNMLSPVRKDVTCTFRHYPPQP